jgi:hypothetical protein
LLSSSVTLTLRFIVSSLPNVIGNIATD